MEPNFKIKTIINKRKTSVNTSLTGDDKGKKKSMNLKTAQKKICNLNNREKIH